MVTTENKLKTGEFKYRLFLPQATENQYVESEKLGLMTTKSFKIHQFANNCG